MYKLKWDYTNQILDINMPKYVEESLVMFRYKYKGPWYAPLIPKPRKYGKAAQEVDHVDTSLSADKDTKNIVQ